MFLTLFSLFIFLIIIALPILFVCSIILNFKLYLIIIFGIGVFIEFIYFIGIVQIFLDLTSENIS